MNEPTPEQIAKLPKWAQEHIADLTRQRADAVKTLNDFCDNDTPSPFYFEENECTGEERGPTRKRRYVQAFNMVCEAHGVRVSICDSGLSGQRGGIVIQWDTPSRMVSEIALIPESFQRCRLVTRENMRA